MYNHELLVWIKSCKITSNICVNLLLYQI
ncbi:unnamed protein product [Spirodela intermedia]|uniref:Uncharacterized protein n=1 Tax=Spirodela intermedia TaxID=51605 RepID=A0A7I8J070_SPIIN|nr:unnamed protein product [Spirodela intermedia]CAA6663605.1 unnamed protein product [Spirodela intermedia]